MPQSAIDSHGELSHTRPSRAIVSITEGDLIMGANSGSAVGTLVERTTRLTMLLHLPDDHGATAVRDATTAMIATLPEQLRRSLT